MCEVMRAPFWPSGSLAIWTMISWPSFSSSEMEAWRAFAALGTFRAFGTFGAFGTFAASTFAALGAVAAFGALGTFSGTVGGAVGANFVTLARAAFHRRAGLAAITTVSAVATLTAAHAAGGAASLLDKTLARPCSRRAAVRLVGMRAGSGPSAPAADASPSASPSAIAFSLGIAFAVGFVVPFRRLGLRGAGCSSGAEQFIDVAGFGFVDLGKFDAVAGFVLEVGRRLDGSASGGHGVGEFGAWLRFGFDGEFSGGGGARLHMHGLDRGRDRRLRDLLVDGLVDMLVGLFADMRVGLLVDRLGRLGFIGFIGLVDFFDD